MVTLIFLSGGSWERRPYTMPLSSWEVVECGHGHAHPHLAMTSCPPLPYKSRIVVVVTLIPLLEGRWVGGDVGEGLLYGSVGR